MEAGVDGVLHGPRAQRAAQRHVTARALSQSHETVAVTVLAAVWKARHALEENVHGQVL